MLAVSDNSWGRYVCDIKPRESEQGKPADPVLAAVETIATYLERDCWLAVSISGGTLYVVQVSKDRQSIIH